MRPCYLWFVVCVIFFLGYVSIGCSPSKEENATESAPLFSKEEAENKFDQDSLKTGKWMEYFTEDFESLPDSTNHFLYRLAEYKEGKPFGKIAYYYRSGKLRYEAYITEVSDTSTKYKGLSKTYYENGQPEIIANYNNDGKRTGTEIRYYENGNLKYKRFHDKEDFANGVSYLEDGEVAFKYFPNLSESTNDIDKRVAFFDNFAENYCDWNIDSTAYYKSQIVEGSYLIEYLKKGYEDYFLIPFEIDTEKDFEISAEVNVLQTNDENVEYGLIWGAKDNKNYHVFRIAPYNNAHKYFRTINGIFSNENYFKPDSYIPRMLKISVEKSKNIINLKINGEIAETAPFQEFFGDGLGFVVGGGSIIVTFDKLTVKYKRT